MYHTHKQTITIFSTMMIENQTKKTKKRKNKIGSNFEIKFESMWLTYDDDDVYKYESKKKSVLEISMFMFFFSL